MGGLLLDEIFFLIFFLEMALGEFYELGGWVGEGCEGSIRLTFSRGMYEVCGALECL